MRKALAVGVATGLRAPDTPVALPHPDGERDRWRVTGSMNQRIAQALMGLGLARGEHARRASSARGALQRDGPPDADYPVPLGDRFRCAAAVRPEAHWPRNVLAAGGRALNTG